MGGKASDAWITAEVGVSCGIWVGSFSCEFRLSELRCLAEDLRTLYERLSGAIILEPAEPNLILKLTGDGKGHILLEGRAEPEFYSGTYLVFTIPLDQTDLPPIIHALIRADPPNPLPR